MKQDQLVGCIGLVFVVIIVASGISTLFAKFLWWFVVQDIFTGAIEQGLIPMTLTWWQAFKLGVFGVPVFGSFFGRTKSSS